MPALPSREIRLKSRPIGLPSDANFELATTEAPIPADGEVQVRNLWMSVDPYMRGRMTDRPSYVPPFEIGKALQGGTVGEVVDSRDPGFAPGDLVLSMAGWREAFTAIPKAAMLEKLPRLEGVPSQAFLGVLGMTGLTAYGGLLEIGQPKTGDTVFISGAAGAVGSIVCQIAKLKRCTVIGSVGSDDKARWLTSLGIDHVVNYKTAGNLLQAVRQAAPKGIDIYFDNVGGEHLEVALDVARPFARFVECGMISGYNEAVSGPRNIILVVGKNIRMEGFIVSMLAARIPDLTARFRADMGRWIKEGKVKWEETVEHGIERAPQAFLNLFTGSNIGKMLVKLG